MRRGEGRDGAKRDAGGEGGALASAGRALTTAGRALITAARALALAAQRFWTQNMLHHAAALTYHSLLSLFQAVLLAVAALGLLGTQQTLDRLAAFLVDYGANRSLVEGVIAAGRNAVQAKGTSAVALAVGLVVAVFFASSAFVAATTALNVVMEATDHRSILRRRLHAAGATLVVIALGLGAVIAVFLGGELAVVVFSQIGLGEGAAELWGLLRLPLAGLLAMSAFAWLYYAAPTIPDPRWRWITLGASVAVLVWLVGSVLFFLFVASFPSYNATYGAFATAILLVVWLWLTNVALLYGAEVNAAGRFAEAAHTPMSRTGDSPEDAQHAAARADPPDA